MPTTSRGLFRKNNLGYLDHPVLEEYTAAILGDTKYHTATVTVEKKHPGLSQPEALDGQRRMVSAAEVDRAIQVWGRGTI